jgi:putative intracellular protease/amidase
MGENAKRKVVVCRKEVASLCHSPGVLHRVTYEGPPIVKGKRVTGFTNEEERGAPHQCCPVPR